MLDINEKSPQQLVADCGRFIGFHPMVKRTVNEEARPTEVCIAPNGNGNAKRIKLESDQEEADFILGKLPTGMRAYQPGEDISEFLEHHIIRDLDIPVTEDNPNVNIKKVPKGYEGLKEGDLLVFSMGGSGDAFKFAASRQCDEVGAWAIHCSPHILHGERTRADRNKADDCVLLIDIAKNTPEIFLAVHVRDRQLGKVRGRYRMWRDAQLSKVQCNNRTVARSRDAFFCNDGGFPAGEVEQFYTKMRGNDAVLAALVEEEKKGLKALENALKELPIYTEVLEPIVGVGPSIAGRIVNHVMDIRRFPQNSDAEFKKYFSVHVDEKKRLPRRRTGQPAEGVPALRQAVYLLASEQFVRRKQTPWGRHFLWVKEQYQQLHPHPELVYYPSDAEEFTDENRSNAPLIGEPGPGGQWEKKKGEYIIRRKNQSALCIPMKTKAKPWGGVTRYSKGHLHKMTVWRSATHFVSWLYGQWYALYGGEPLDPYYPDDHPCFAGMPMIPLYHRDEDSGTSSRIGWNEGSAKQGGDEKTSSSGDYFPSGAPNEEAEETEDAEFETTGAGEEVRSNLVETT